MDQDELDCRDFVLFKKATREWQEIYARRYGLSILDVARQQWFHRYLGNQLPGCPMFSVGLRFGL